MGYSIGIKRKYSSPTGDRESQVIINPGHIAHAEYKPAYEAEIDERTIPIEQTLTLHFAGTEPLKLNGAPADEVWNELKRTLPDYMRIPLEPSRD